MARSISLGGVGTPHQNAYEITADCGILVRSMNRNTDLAIGPAFEIGDRKTFKEWVGPDNLLSLGTACCVGGIGIRQC
jgi:hypothetical protein